MKLLPTACILTHATPKSIVLDLYSPTSVLVPAHDKVLINTGNAFQIPMGYYGWIAPYPCKCWGGGPWLHWSCPSIIIELQSPEPCYRSKSSHSPINSGKKIAYPILCEVPQIPPTESGAHGFGSTGQ